MSGILTRILFVCLTFVFGLKSDSTAFLDPSTDWDRSSDPPRDSYADELAHAHEVRVALDAKRAQHAFPLSKRQKYLSEVATRNKNNFRSFDWAHQHVEHICRSVRHSCSWDDAMFLLSLFANVKYSGVEKMSVESQWLVPTELLHKHKPNRSKQVQTCVRLTSLPSAAEFLYYYLSRSVPFVVEGALHWPATKKWTNTTYLLEMLRKERVRVYASLDADFEKVQNGSAVLSLLKKRGVQFADESIGAEHERILIRPAETEMSFEQYLHLSSKRYRNKEKAVFYLQKHDLRYWRHVHNVSDDLTPSLFGEDSFTRMLSLEHYLLWMATPREKVTNKNKIVARGPIHYDAQENIHVTVSGTKHYLLFHPSDSAALYESEASYRTLHLLYRSPQNASASGRFFALPVTQTHASIQPFSPVNITHPDLTVYPRFASAVPISCTVNAGDLIYIPSYHWHEVTSFAAHEAPTIGVNMFFRPWWMKGSDLQHYSLNTLYSHLHAAVYGDDTNESEALERVAEALRSDRWKIDSHSSKTKRQNGKNMKKKKPKRRRSRSPKPYGAEL